MTTLQRFYTDIEPLDEMTVAGILSTQDVAHDLHSVVTTGIDYTSYLYRTPIVNWQHDPMCPVGTMTAIGLVSDTMLAGKIRFADIGISPKADEIRALVKSGVIRGISISFNPLETEPLDKAKPRGGLRILRCELVEVSFVGTPSDRRATVTARHAPRTAGQLAMLDALPATPPALLARAAEAFKSQRSDGRLISHATQVALLLQAAEERQGHSYAARQRTLERLRQIGRRNAN
jgi:HK97 family phage prohead protease